MSALRDQMATATETAVVACLGPAEATLAALNDVLDPDLAIEAQHVRITLSHFRTKAAGWLASRQAVVDEPDQP